LDLDRGEAIVARCRCRMKWASRAWTLLTVRRSTLSTRFSTLWESRSRKKNASAGSTAIARLTAASG